ncbi:DUF6289 family protein [Nonomuraea sp. NPDC049269]|uniref:DUF6289 family protein n=1 Tax=Nonomuraea sp. NPDC049269 TaxID=3364349 RepID=UPI003722810E
MIRRALLAVLLVLGSFATITTVTSAPAFARACALGYTCVSTYYTDETRTTVAGVRRVGCEGETLPGWGVKTIYLDFQETPC